MGTTCLFSRLVSLHSRLSSLVNKQFGMGMEMRMFLADMMLSRIRMGTEMGMFLAVLFLSRMRIFFLEERASGQVGGEAAENIELKVGVS